VVHFRSRRNERVISDDLDCDAAVAADDDSAAVPEVCGNLIGAIGVGEGRICREQVFDEAARAQYTHRGTSSAAAWALVWRGS
jgi:hypothetical protein